MSNQRQPNLEAMGIAALVGEFRPRNSPGQPVVGWTTPAIIYGRMDEINVSAQSLDVDVVMNVKRPSFVAAWKAWLDKVWTPFYKKYKGLSAVLGAVLYTDELAAQTEQHALTLKRWYDGYGAEKDEKGELLKRPVGPPPAPTPPPEEKKKEDESWFESIKRRLGIPVIPWWLYLIGGTVVAGGGYLVYRAVRNAVRETQESAKPLYAVKQKLTSETVPRMLEAQTSVLPVRTDPDISPFDRAPDPEPPKPPRQQTDYSDDAFFGSDEPYDGKS